MIAVIVLLEFVTVSYVLGRSYEGTLLTEAGY